MRYNESNIMLNKYPVGAEALRLRMIITLDRECIYKMSYQQHKTDYYWFKSVTCNNISHLCPIFYRVAMRVRHHAEKELHVK